MSCRDIYYCKMDKIIILFIFLAVSGCIDSKICKVRNQYRWLRCHCYSSNINAMICNGARIVSIKQLKIPDNVKLLNLKYNHIKEFDIEFITNNPNVEVLDISAQSGFNCNSLEFVENVAVDIISDCARSMDMDITTVKTAEARSTTTVKTFAKYTAPKMRTEAKRRQLTLSNLITSTKRAPTVSTTLRKMKAVISRITVLTTTTTKTTTSTTISQPKLQTIKLRPPVKIHPSSTSTSTQSTKKSIATELTSELTTEAEIIEKMKVSDFVAITIVTTTLLITVGGITIVACVIVVKRKCMCVKCTRVKIRCCCIAMEVIRYDSIPMAAIAIPQKTDDSSDGGDSNVEEGDDNNICRYGDEEETSVVRLETLYSADDVSDMYTIFDFEILNELFQTVEKYLHK